MRTGIGAQIIHEGGIAQRKRATGDGSAHTHAGHRVEVLHAVELEVPASGLGHDGIGQRMLAALVQAGRQVQHLVGVEALEGHDFLERGASFGEGAGLVDDEGIDAAHVLDGLGIAEQHAHLCRLAGGDHDRHRRGQTQRAGAGDDQHRNRVQDGKGPGRLRAEEAPDEEGGHRDRQDREHEPVGDGIGHPLHRRASALRLRDQLHDLRQHSVGTHLGGADHQRAGAVLGRADDLIASGFLDRDRLAGEHRLVDPGAAFHHFAIHRQLFAGSHAQVVADMHVG